MNNDRYYTELGIKINKLRISLRFRKAAIETAVTEQRERFKGTEPYWEFRQVSKDGLFLVCTPIATCAADELAASTTRINTPGTVTASSSFSSSSSRSTNSVCAPPPVPPKSSSTTLVAKPKRPPYPSSIVSKKRDKALKRSSYV